MSCFYLKNNARKKVRLRKLTLKTVEKDFRPGGLDGAVDRAARRSTAIDKWILYKEK